MYGPPGTGKTLVARVLSKALNSVEPKIVNGPELLDQFVGGSEKKMRELFEDAEHDEEKLGDQSPLHVIIFDEIDALCRTRGSSASSSQVNDNLVN